MTNMWIRLLRVGRAFARARQGNVAVTFAIGAIPLVAFVGAAVDYSRANSVKADMQAALDSTALMLSKEAATDTADALNANALKYFTALFNRPGVTVSKVTADYTSTGGSAVTVNAWVAVPTDFIGVLAIVFNNEEQLKNLTVYASSTSTWGTSRLRVALVLDNTGSMGQSGKLDALKTATSNLLNQLKGAVSTDGDVYVSIVPFVKDVNVDAANYGQPWIYWDDGVTTADNYWDALNGSCSRGSSFKTRSRCLATPSCSKSRYTTSSDCTSNGGTWYTAAGTWTPSAHSTWNGCVTDRGTTVPPGTTAGYDQDVTAPTTGIAATLFPAEQYSACPQAMLGLSYDWTAMQSLVTNMVANGSTNQPIGLVWGWQSLAGGGPFSVPPMDPGYTYNQVIILLSDGLNTQDRWYGNGSSTSTSVDDRMYDSSGDGTCANIKAAGITIYTIQVNTDGAPTSTLLENCASNTQGTTDHFFLLTSADEIITTFQAIGTNLTKLRVAN